MAETQDAQPTTQTPQTPALQPGQQQIQVENLALTGDLNLFEDFQISVVLQGKNMHFACDWHVGEQGLISFDFTQSQPVVLIVDDIFPNNRNRDK
jgi:hypothetical protein